MTRVSVLIAWCLASSATGIVRAADALPPDFLDGDDVVLGRAPGGGEVYAGRARIHAAGGKLTLERRLDGAASETLVGGLESAAGGEARVVRFRGPVTHAPPNGAAPTHAAPTGAAPTHAAPNGAALTHAAPNGAAPTHAAPAGAGSRTLTCLVASDLDNYGRLSCHWTFDARPDPGEPGLETFFATGAWPDASPHKSFDHR